MDKNIYFDYDDTHIREDAKKREFGHVQSRNLTIGNQSKIQTVIQTIKNILLIIALLTFIIATFILFPHMIKHYSHDYDSTLTKDLVKEKNATIQNMTTAVPEEDSDVVDIEETEPIISQPWKHLQCQKGHKYFFSTRRETWETSLTECKLYGGWLLEINNQAEQDCLLKYAWNQNFNDWYWTDAKRDPSSGLFVHAKTNKVLTWFAPVRSCSGNGNFQTYKGGNTVILAIFNNEHKNIHGAWCDSYSSNNQKIPFICEAKI